MGIASYFPSAQFTLIVVSLALAGGFVWGADYVTEQKDSAPAVEAGAPSTLQAGLDWQATLAAIQGESAPAVARPEAVQELLQGAQSNNLTATIGRTLLVGLSEAKSQGLGSDIPTQESLVAQALAKIEAQVGPRYTQKDLSLSTNSSAALTAYGNAFMAAVARHPQASFTDTLVAVGTALDTGSTATLNDLGPIKQAYTVLTVELAALPVPPNLAPFHLQIVNDLAAISATYDDMGQALTDPLRALAGLKRYQALTDEVWRVLTNIAQHLQKNAILFANSEPGSAWASLVSP